MSAWSEWFSNERGKSGLTQAALAKRLGVSTSSVAMWEQGQRVLPKDRWYDLCSVLDLGPRAQREGEALYFGGAPESGR
jgi:transcriptional regulator with XRE-family HTH domain